MEEKKSETGLKYISFLVFSLSFFSTRVDLYLSATQRVPAPSLFPSRTAVMSTSSCLTPSLGGETCCNTTILTKFGLLSPFFRDFKREF